VLLVGYLKRNYSTVRGNMNVTTILEHRIVLGWWTHSSCSAFSYFNMSSRLWTL